MKMIPAPRRMFTLAMLCLPLALAACSDPPARRFKSTDITNGPIRGDFELSDHQGNIRRLADFRGKLVVVFFGFTSCPDVCPTTLYKLSEAMKRLGKDAGAVQVLMITVDPPRDTREVVAKYVPSFDPRFIGLVPTGEQLEQVAGEFKAFVSRNQPNDAGYYTVDHTAASFVFDRRGRARLLVPHDFSGEDWAADLHALLPDS